MPIHIYKHEPHAIETFLLTTFLAFNLYHAFVAQPKGTGEDRLLTLPSAALKDRA